jgi:undecaprenyl diphosphate synthase
MSDTTPSLPNHLGIIIDGNRRWARAQNLPTIEGHRRGYDKVKEIGEVVMDRGVNYLTIYAFSIENWKRTADEVGYLLKLLQDLVTTEVAKLHEKNIRVRFLGSPERLPQRTLEAMRKAEELTKDNTRGVLGICINYGGQTEIADAIKGIVTDKLPAESITPEAIEKYLYAPEIPPVDLIIRTSGEHRISNFMLWRAAYAELYFIEKHWPDFTAKDLDVALADYAQRQRRFGK